MSTIFDAVKEKEPILFIGAGFSKCLGLPDWKELLYEILDVCEDNQEIKQGNKAQIEVKRKGILEILDEYKNQKELIYEKVIQKKIIVDENHSNLRRVEKLWGISDKIITTNYDNALEITGKKTKKVIENDAAFELAKLSTTNNYILNLHGSIKKVESCVLFTSDFEKIYYGDTLIKRVFENIIVNNVMIFVGFSMGDPYINNIFKRINDIYKGYLSNHYIITTNNNTDFSQFNIKSHNIGNWDAALEKLLDDLIESRRDIKAQSVSSEPSKISIVSYSPTNTLDKYPQLNTLFTGREKELALFKVAFTNHRVFAIEGLGGFGKTDFAAKCIDTYIENKENIVWLNGNKESKFDSFIENIGYGEILTSELKTQQAIFSSLFNLIERDKKIIFLDNFQAIESDLFVKFIEYAQQILKESTIVIISKKDISINGTSPHVININGLENALEYAQKIRNSEDKFNEITDNDLELLVANTLEHPLAIKLCMPLLKKGIKVEELIQKIVAYKGQGLAEVEELTKRIFDEAYNHASTTEKERVLLKNISVFNGLIKKEAIDFLLSSDQFVYLSKLQDSFLVTKEQENYSFHPLIKELAYNLLENKVEIHAKAAKYFLSQRKDNLIINLEENIFYHLGNSKQWDIVNQEIDLRGRDLMLKGNYELIKEFIGKLRDVNISNSLFDIFLGEIEQINGRFDVAIKHYENACLQNLNIEVKAEGNLKLGEIYYYKGEIKKSFEKFNTVFEISKNEGFKKLEAESLNNLGSICEFNGKYEEAIQFYNDSLKIHKEIGYQQGIATCLGNLGNVFHSQGKYGEAIEFHNASLKIKKEIGHQQGIATSLGSLGNVFHSQEKYGEAIEFHNASLKIERETGHQLGIATSLGNLGSIFYSQRKYDAAIEFHNNSLKIEKEIGHTRGIATSLGNLGSVFHSQGKYGEAIEFHNASLKIEKEIGNQQGIAASLGNLGSVFHSKKKYSEAIEFHNESLKIKKEIGHQQGIASSLHNLGCLYVTKEKLNYTIALSYFLGAIIIFKKMGIPNTATLSWINDIRTKHLKEKFKQIAYEVYNDFEEQDREFIDIRAICREPLKSTIPTRNSPCPCGSGKQYKRCHGK